MAAGFTAVVLVPVCTAVAGFTSRFTGTAAGIDDEGALLLRDEGGRIQRFRAGEVTLEKLAL